MSIDKDWNSIQGSREGENILRIFREFSQTEYSDFPIQTKKEKIERQRKYTENILRTFLLTCTSTSSTWRCRHGMIGSSPMRQLMEFFRQSVKLVHNHVSNNGSFWTWWMFFCHGLTTCSSSSKGDTFSRKCIMNGWWLIVDGNRYYVTRIMNQFRKWSTGR